MSKETYAVFAEDLMQFPLEDVRSACKNIGSAPRQQGEKAFPEVGTIIAECSRLGQLRRVDGAKRNSCAYCCDGMAVKLNRIGQPVGVTRCKQCGGAEWMDRSLAHNRSLQGRGAA